jgi:hypothetical protein
LERLASSDDEERLRGGSSSGIKSISVDIDLAPSSEGENFRRMEPGDMGGLAKRRAEDPADNGKFDVTFFLRLGGTGDLFDDIFKLMQSY